MPTATDSSATNRVADFVAYSAGVDRVTLGAELGLPMPTVISAVQRLIANGTLVESDRTRVRSSAGRRPRVLHRAGPPAAFGMIMWQTDGLGVACHDFTGKTLSSRVLKAPDPYAGADGLEPAVDRLRAMARRAPGRDLRAIVVSVQGPFLHGYGTPASSAPRRPDGPAFPIALTGDLERALFDRHGLPVVMENDVNLAALGELYGGAGAGVRNFVQLKINDDGFGCGIVANGQLVRGAHGFAGELAHLQIDPDGGLCECGGRGCLGARLRALVARAARPGERASFASLARLAAARDPGAIRMLTDVGRTLGRPLAHLCTFLDPERLIVSTTVDPAAEYILNGLRETFRVQAPPTIADGLDMRRGAAGLDNEVRGAIETLRERARHPR